MKKLLKAIINVSWKLLPWALAIRGFYLFMGVALSTFRYNVAKDKSWLEVCNTFTKEQFVMSMTKSLGITRIAANASWKWALKFK